MKLISVRLLFLLLPSLFFACSQEKGGNKKLDEVPIEERTEKALLDEVIGIHDEVMPKIEAIVMLQGNLQKQLDSLIDSNSDSEKIEMLKENIINLRKADSAMMSWMRQFKPVGDTVNHEQRIEYLELERERIKKVKEMMNSSVAEAQKIAN